MRHPAPRPNHVTRTALELRVAALARRVAAVEVERRAFRAEVAR